MKIKIYAALLTFMFFALILGFIYLSFTCPIAAVSIIIGYVLYLIVRSVYENFYDGLNGGK